MGGQPYIDPTFAGDQAAGTPSGGSPAGWLVDYIRAWWDGNIDTISRGMPAPMGPRDKYPSRRSPVKQPHPFGAAKFLLTRRYDRGAYAYAYRGGALAYDPLGAGVVYTQQLPIMQRAATVLPHGDALFWTAQTVNFAITPASGAPIYTPDMLAAMMGNPALNNSGDSSIAVNYIAPPDGGFGT